MTEGKPCCGAVTYSPDEFGIQRYSWICTLDKGHEGPHIAHGADLKKVCHTWPQEEEDGDPSVS